MLKAISFLLAILMLFASCSRDKNKEREIDYYEFEIEIVGSDMSFSPHFWLNNVTDSLFILQHEIGDLLSITYEPFADYTQWTIGGDATPPEDPKLVLGTCKTCEGGYVIKGTGIIEKKIPRKFEPQPYEKIGD